MAVLPGGGPALRSYKVRRRGSPELPAASSRLPHQRWAPLMAGTRPLYARAGIRRAPHLPLRFLPGSPHSDEPRTQPRLSTRRAALPVVPSLPRRTRSTGGTATAARCT